jgi:seryl-tRNA synthetase
MVLDINLFRTPESLKIVEESHTKRYGNSSLIEDIVTSDREWRQILAKRDKYSALENILRRTIGSKIKENNNKKSNKVNESEEEIPSSEDNQGLDPLLVDKIPNIDKNDLEQLTVEQLKELNNLCGSMKDKLKQSENDYIEIRDITLKSIGNILHPSVPVGPNDDSNIEIYRSNINTPLVGKILPHYELLAKIDCVDYKAGSDIAGNRGYFLKGACVFLSQALQHLSLNLLDEQNYQPVQTPYFMKAEVMAEVAQLSQFDEELYKIVGSGAEVEDGTKYLIATSEQPLTALHSGQNISGSALPIKYAGISTCFRREAGRGGKDTSGIFRVHQFEKVEQFIICSSDDSWIYLEEMLNMSKSLLDCLQIPYRVVNIASGELNLAAAKKYDIEGWFPGSSTYRELVSCSNCTDYHSRNLKIKYTSKTAPAGKYVHMLNATMCAVTRMICIILENYQKENGIEVPKALQPYMPSRYKEFIPFVK